MKHTVLRLIISIGVATGLLGILQTVAYAGDPVERIGANHSEPQR